MNILEKYNIDIEKVIKKLPWKNWGSHFNVWQVISSKKWNQLQVVCPFHADSSPSMWISKEKNAYNCFVCSMRVWESKVIDKEKSIWKWTFIQLLRVFYEQVLNKNITDLELADLLEVSNNDKRFFLSDLKNAKQTYHVEWQKKEIVEKEPDEIHYKYSLLKDEDKGNLTYLKSRLEKYKDITSERFNETINHFLLKTQANWSIIIPIIKSWYLIWLYVRQIEDWFWKYYNLKPFKKTNVIFNWDFVENYQNILLVEGPLNAIRLWSLWYENVVSLFWSKPYKEQIELLNTKKNIYVWFDQDMWGKNWVEELQKNLWKGVNLYSLDGEWKKDAFDYSKEEIQSLFKWFKQIK